MKIRRLRQRARPAGNGYVLTKQPSTTHTRQWGRVQSADIASPTEVCGWEANISRDAEFSCLNDLTFTYFRWIAAVLPSTGRLYRILYNVIVSYNIDDDSGRGGL